MAEPWRSHSVRPSLDSLDFRPMTEREYRRALDGVHQTMTMYDACEPKRREFIAELNIKRGTAAYAEWLRTTAPRCHHGRIADTCAQCLWDKHQASGGRQASQARVADVLERARARRDV